MTGKKLKNEIAGPTSERKLGSVLFSGAQKRSRVFVENKGRSMKDFIVKRELRKLR